MDGAHGVKHLPSEVLTFGKEQGPVIDSRTLFAGSGCLWIRHHDELYRLQLTRNDRLILIK